MRERQIIVQMLAMMKLMLWVMWPITATAAQLSFSKSLYTTDVMLDLLLTACISILVGLSGLLVHMKNEYQTAGKIDHLWLFVSSKMMCSLIAGIGMYFGADWLQLARSGTVIAIILASFSGTVLLETGANTFIGWLTKKMTS